jgi:dTDP-6-deoxy-L-talose 4-dehydrogenase (NAD+)
MDAIGRKDDTFNMSNGDQLYDYMNIEEVAEKLCILATSEVPKIVYVCNGYPITLKSLMQNILKKKSSPLKLNLGFYPYRPNESLALWGAESFESQIK